MLAICKKVLGSTPATIRQILGARETTLSEVRFIATTRADRRPQKKEFGEDAEARDAGQGMEGVRLEWDDEGEIRDVREGGEEWRSTVNRQQSDQYITEEAARSE